MIKRKVYDINDIDLTVPAGGIVSISLYNCRPYPTNDLEMAALGVFVKRLGGNQVHLRKGAPNNYEDVCYRNAHGEIVTIDRDDADDPNVSYAVIPYRLLDTPARRAFVKNFVIVDKTLSTTPYIGVTANIGSDPNFIPVRADSILGEDLVLAINSL
jgi:hypothetical protein|nr:MAG TPA: hypothetical protein [Caudoviricetes sp.]